MKSQEVVLRAMAKRITWWQAAEIIGISDWQMRRRRHERFGYDGLYGPIPGALFRFQRAHEKLQEGMASCSAIPV